MKHHHVLQRAIWVVGACLLPIGILLTFLVWAAAPTVQAAEDTAPAVAEASPTVSLALTGSRSMPIRPRDARRAVSEAWEKARDAGAYSFATRLSQVIYPARALSSLGRGPEQAELHMAGTIDQPARTLDFELWQPGLNGAGSAVTPGSAAEVRIEADRAYVRPAGSEWQEVQDFSSSFAPDNDPLAFLAGIKDVAVCELQARSSALDSAGIAGPAGLNSEPGPAASAQATCYRFSMDGPVLAIYLRDRLERQLAERGELPLGVALDAPRAFQEMTGDGELWVDGNGLPLLLSMHLAFPEEHDGSHLDIDIQTDFSGFPVEAAAAPGLNQDPVAWAGAALGLNDPTLPARAAKAGGVAGVIVCSLGVAALLLGHSRSRRLYTAIVLAVILSMVVAPLIQNQRAAAFFERQGARSRDLSSLVANGQVLDPESAQEAQAAQTAIADSLAPAWDPQRDPLAQAEQPAQMSDLNMLAGLSDLHSEILLAPEEAPQSLQLTSEPPPGRLQCDQDAKGDPDGDGVNDFEECVYFLNPGNPDSDNDGLTDGQELKKLATDPKDPDTDADVISDTLEVKGFIYPAGGQHWYLDPNNPDTNNDSMIDSAECPALVGVTDPPDPGVIGEQCDTDHDGVPNPFDTDNDNDGVPDAVDLSPDESVDVNGKRVGQAGVATAFNGDRPFMLSVSDLKSDWPVFVDLQLRPVVPNRLAYAMNVLDWPAGDVDGQIQHGKIPDTTFANSDNPDIRNPGDTTGANGDLRLVPLLEIMMTGNHVPLALTDLAVTATVQGDISATVTLTPNASNSDTLLTFTFDQPGLYNVEIYDSACPISGITDQKFTGLISGAVKTYADMQLVDLADGQHAMLFSSLGGASKVCANIPDVVNGPYRDRMVDMSVLEPYGITVQDQADGSVLAYVPLNVTSDDTGGGKTAFQARMLYWPGALTWGEAQQMKVVWLVQMLTDSCSADVKSWEQFETEYKASHDKPKDTEIEEAYNTYFDDFCAANRTMDQIIPVHVYDESWYLTGLSVREDHGLDVAVSYVNPSLETYDDDALWTLSLGLGEQFMTGLDCETDATALNGGDPDPDDEDPDTCWQDGKRDLAVSLYDHSGTRIGNSTIEQRFDITSTVPITQRWGIAQNALMVENHKYAHQDYLAYYAMTQTPRILGYYGHEVDPTLLLAREERFRAARLEAATMPAGGALTVNLNDTDYPERALAGLQWTPYRYNSDLGDWEATPATEYWDILEVELGARFYELYPDDDAETNMGRVATARAYSFALINSLATTVVHCTNEKVLCPLPKAMAPYSDDMLIKATKDFVNGLSAVTVKVIFTTIDSRKSFRTVSLMMDFDRNGQYTSLDEILDDPDWQWIDQTHPEKSFFKSLGDQLKSRLTASKTVFFSGPKIRVAGGIVVGAAVAAVIATVVVSAVFGADGGQIAAMLIRTLSLAIATHGAIVAISSAMKLAKTFKGFLSVARANMGLRANLSAAGVITTVIQVLVTWAAFVGLFYSNDMVVGSMTFDSTLAGTIADTITAVVLFVIFTALGPIGAIASAIVGLINAIANLICSALPEDMQTSKVGSVLCRGITGIISTLFKRWIYSGTILVEMDPDGYDRLSLYNFDTTLVDEEAGLVTGALMRYNIGMTNTIDLVKVPINSHELFWFDQFNDDNLKKANFDYRWQDTEEAFHAGLSLGGMTGSWQAAADEHRYYAPDAADSAGIPLGAAGINQTLEGLVLSEAYVLPEQECWGWKIWSYCSIQAEKSTNHFDIGSSIIYDILPATLDGFYELTAKGDGQALAWGQEGDLTFPILYDADGDGLPRTDDPDDSKWDADGDGLSDPFELQNGSDPILKDSDDDGLTDLQEARLGSDPGSADSDGDGLYDCQEVFHQIEVVGDSIAQDECGQAVGSWTGGWEFVYSGAGSERSTTHVTANPVDVDSDGDGLTDQQELIYGYNPGATSNLNVLSLSSQLEERIGGLDQPSDGFVAPGQTLSYSATVKNELDNRQAEGLLWTEASDALDVSGVVPQSFNLWPQTQANMAGTLQVNPAASGSYSLTQVAGALISDLSAESDNAALWLRFDDPPGSTTYLDTSGRFPAHDGQCVGSGCVLDTAGGRTGGALKLDGTSYVDVPLDVSETAYALSLWFKTTCTNCGIFSADAGTAGTSHDRHVYLNGGNVCVRVYRTSGSDIVCTAYANYADGQWHHLVHTFAANEISQRIYLDGVLKAIGVEDRSDFIWQDGINIGFSKDAAVDYFSGSIDDVRIFDDALTQRQVQALANLPLFHMDFDQSNGWIDVSSFKWPMPICLGDCPTYTSGISGGGAHFNSSSYLSVTAAPHLNLSGGRLTLSAWIYPRPYSSFNQSILGLNAGGGDAYPTLQRVGRKLLFGLGTGGSYLTQITAGDVLTEDQWNHVAVTLDKDAGGENLRFYVNGELVEKFSFPVTTIAPTTSFEIGRADPYASVSMPWYHVYDNGDEGLIYPAVEMCATIGGQEVWNETVKKDTTVYPTFNVTFKNRTSLVIFEDDGDTRCGSSRDDHDDTCTIDFYNTSLLLDTRSESEWVTHYIEDCGTGQFSLMYTNNSIPFYGDIDEVQIFGQPLDEDAIRQLYLDHATLMYLPLDEAPGARAYEDASLAHVAASCAGSLCPSSGTTGRINQAAWFDRQNGTAIQLGTSPARELVNSFTVAAWINPRSLPDWQRIVSVATNNSANGWGFGLLRNELLFTHFGVKDYTTNGLALDTDRWTHVAVVVSSDNKINFYVNGALFQTLPGVGVGHQNNDDPLLVGALTGYGYTNPTQVFDGQIDDLWIFNAPLSAASIEKIYLSAPRLHLLFDEAYGATAFADNAAYGRFATCTAPACPATGEGVPGQIGLAAQFDGEDDYVDGSNLNPPNMDGDFTLTQWFTLDELGAAPTYRDWAAPVGKGAYNAAVGWAVLVNRDIDDASKHTINLYLNGTIAATIPAPTGGWAPGRWYQYTFTRNGATIKGYLNGVEKTSSTATPVSVANSDPLLLGKNQTGRYFWQGKLDDLRFYVQALTAGQIRDLYLYQSAWVENRQSHNLTVDSDAPSATVLITDSTYLANQAIWVGLTADDPTSDVAKVELGVQKGSGTVTWSTAARCIENLNQPEGAWCAQFTPVGEGRYTLYGRATDLEGNTGSSDSVGVYVDDTAPTVAVDDISEQLLNVVESEGRPRTWVVHLSGTVEDPPLVSGQAGSGVPADGLHVTLRGAGGEALGDAGQTATISGTAWSLDYEIGKAEPDGCYELEVKAVDQVARIPNLIPAQVTQHTSVVTSPVVVRASAPAVLLNQGEAIAGGQLGPGVTLLGGETTHRPVPVEVDLTTTAGADQTRVWLSCQHGNEGSWYTPFDVLAGSLTAGSTQVWEEELHHWSSCQITATTTATPVGGVSGVVKVCGTEIAQWSGDFAGSTTVPFTVHSDSCFVAGCPVDSSPPVASVQGVDLAFRSVLPGSAFVNEVPPTSTLLYLPFEDTPDGNGQLVVRDVSGAGHNGTCSGTTCPVPGQQGHSGSAAFFDGQDDALKLDAFTAGLPTVSAWIRPTGATNTRETIVSFKEDAGCGFVLDLQNGSNGYPEFYIRYRTPANTVSWQRISDPHPVSKDRWTHLAGVYDGETMYLYRDGELVAKSGSMPGTIWEGYGTQVGVGARSSLDQHYFPGLIDDVRIFNRPMTAAEIKSLFYAGPGPLLALSFEEAWATDGASLPDASGWEHHAVLHSGTGDAENKATAGQVGSYALKLDGLNDYANVGDNPELKLSNSGTMAAWIYPTVAKDMPILNREGEYEVYRYADGTIRWAFANTTPGWIFINTEYVAQQDTWTHIAVVYDAGLVQTYANGALVDTYAGAGTIGDTRTTQNELWVGGRSNQATARFGGSLDDVRIYQRALLPEEIADLYHAGWQATTLTASDSSIERSSWTAAVPSGLEGSYQVEMRGRDEAGHFETVNEPSLLWRGEADNLPPRVTVDATSVNASTYRYTTVVEDYHLVETDFNSPCGPGVVTSRETFRSPWYLGISGDTQKLYRLTAVCDLVNYTGAVQATACDSFGNCSTCDLTGNCSTELALTAAAGSPQVTEGSAGSAARVPADSKGAPANKSGPAGFEISAPAVVTTSQYYEPQTIDVDGLVTAIRNPRAAPHALTSVQVTIADTTGQAILSEPTAKRPYTVTWTLPWRLESGSALPDGVSYTAIITATDGSGRTTVVDHNLIADVALPAPVTLSLASNGLPVEPGAIIREPSPDLTLTWTASSDGSGLGPYQAAWRFEDAYTTTIQTSLHDPVSPREAHITAGEAQRISAGLASQDVYGNERWQVLGSVIVDGPLTPDYISLIPGAEGEITGGTCSLLGVDGRIARLSSSDRWTGQRLYGTWDHQALRLTWTGAHWNGDGDLFIYLDTGPASTTMAYDPYPMVLGGRSITLPASLEADALIWVQDQSTASLLRWDGSAWIFETLLSPGQFRFDGGRNGGQTDLYLPFELLGTDAGEPLGLLAFAVEEPVAGEGLRVWATMPRANPVNSSRVNNRLALALPGESMLMNHAYRWGSLSDGVCPNGTNGLLPAQHFNDAVLEMAVESDPPGAALSGVLGGLFWVSDPGEILNSSARESLFGFLHPAHQPLPDGQQVAYTVSYRNEGSHAMQGAWLDLSAHGALQLAVDTIELGDIPPGGEGSVTFQGRVDRTRSTLGLAAVIGRLYDAANGPEGLPLEWLIAAHRVDRDVPEILGLNSPMVVGTRAGWLSGSARDESGVSQVEIEITSPSGAVSKLTCEVAEQASGRWSCPWDATVANGGIKPADGDEFSLRLRATDRHGYTSDWSASHTIRVDAQPPTVTLAAEMAGASPVNLVRGNALRLMGDAQDNHAVGTVTVCLDGACRVADLGAPGAQASWWSRWMLAHGTLDYVTKTLTIRAKDDLGNSIPDPLTSTVVFDNVAPALGARQIMTQVPVGSEETVLNGEVSDGGPDVKVSVRLQPPDGTITRLPAARAGSAWWFDLPADTLGQYSLWVDAEDVAGNVTTAGPFTVQVVCTNAAPVVTSLKAEPVAGWPVSLTLTAVISNAGPESLPAGIPIGFSEGDTTIGQVSTSAPLNAGESQALSLVWAPTGARNYDIGLTAGQNAVLPNGPLCVMPGTAYFSLPVRDAVLHNGWNLISPLVSPSNTDVQVVGRGIDGAYTGILGYDGDLLSYYPDRPQDSTLTTIDALHGYWIQTILPPTATLTETVDESAATWRMSGEILPEDQPLSLASGWNLIGYPPARALTVTTALEGIAGRYGAVLGFEYSALSYYPDLDPSYNTLVHMAPGFGYWISATEAATLQYPITSITNSLPVNATHMARERLNAIRISEWQAGVQPTTEWMNYYGKLSLPDGAAVPVGMVILAVDPQGVICGATAVWQPGQYGLLACYRDDPATEADEGATPGDLIELYVSSDGTQPNGQFIGEGVWMAHGERSEVGETRRR